jgi:hypothetical protein
MKGDFHVRFCERLKLKCFGLLDRLLFGFLLLTSSLVFQSAAVVGRRFSNAATAPSRQRCTQAVRKATIS